MKAIIGLGNPEIQYHDTRHNAGFKVIDHMTKIIELKQFKRSNRLCADINQTILFDIPVLLAKPITYMNDSGKAVLAIKKFYKMELQDFLIIHDDISLPLGKIRWQANGGAGGQHGVESIIEQLGGDKNFNRLKIGIGPDPGGHIRHKYVLQKFNANEQILLDKVIDLAGKSIHSWLVGNVEQCMNEFNGLDLR